MKVRCYKIRDIVCGVYIFEVSVVDIPFAEVSKLDIISVRTGSELPRIRDDSELEPAYRYHTPWNSPAVRISYRPDPSKRRVVTIEGIVAARRIDELLEFLRKNYIPRERSSEIDKLASALREGRISESSFGLSVVEALQRKELMNRNGPVWKKWTEYQLHPFYLFEQESLETCLYSLPSGDQCLVNKQQSSSLRFFAIEYSKRAGRHRIPVCEYVWMDKTGFKDVFLHWDTERLESYEDADEMPLEVLHRFDKRGRELFWWGDGVRLRVLQEFVPRFIVKVPRRESVKGVFSRRRLAKHLPKHAAFLFDSRMPLRLSSGLPVIEEPRDALDILARTTQKLIYIPSMSPRPKRDIETLDNGNAYLVGCTLR